jgi:hypothetical protein
MKILNKYQLLYEVENKQSGGGIGTPKLSAKAKLN